MHERTGPINTKAIKFMISKGTYDMKGNNRIKKQNCSTCVYSIQTRSLSTGSLVSKAKDMTLRMDMCGPFDVKTYSNAKILLTMITIPQRYTNVEVLNSRNEALELCLDYIK